jgi:hypothetical protein
VYPFEMALTPALSREERGKKPEREAYGVGYT